MPFVCDSSDDGKSCILSDGKPPKLFLVIKDCAEVFVEANDWKVEKALFPSDH